MKRPDDVKLNNIGSTLFTKTVKPKKLPPPSESTIELLSAAASQLEHSDPTQTPVSQSHFTPKQILKKSENSSDEKDSNTDPDVQKKSFSTFSSYSLSKKQASQEEKKKSETSSYLAQESIKIALENIAFRQSYPESELKISLQNIDSKSMTSFLDGLNSYKNLEIDELFINSTPDDDLRFLFELLRIIQNNNIRISKLSFGKNTSIKVIELFKTRKLALPDPKLTTEILDSTFCIVSLVFIFSSDETTSTSRLKDLNNILKNHRYLSFIEIINQTSNGTSIGFINNSDNFHFSALILLQAIKRKDIKTLMAYLKIPYIWKGIFNPFRSFIEYQDQLTISTSIFRESIKYSFVKGVEYILSMLPSDNPITNDIDFLSDIIKSLREEHYLNATILTQIQDKIFQLKKIAGIPISRLIPSPFVSDNHYDLVPIGPPESKDDRLVVPVAPAFRGQIIPVMFEKILISSSDSSLISGLYARHYSSPSLLFNSRSNTQNSTPPIISLRF